MALPEVERYFNARTDIEMRRRQAMNEARKRHAANGPVTMDDPRYPPFQREVERIAEVTSREYSNALEDLRRCDDPITRYIARHVLTSAAAIPGDVMYVLKQSPMTPDELDALAVEMDWCFVWMQHRQKAALSGEIPGLEPMSKERFALLEYLDDEYRDHDGIHDIMRYIDAIVDAECGNNST